MLWAVILVVVISFFPLLIGIGVSNNLDSNWKDGYFIDLADKIGGSWLAILMLVGERGCFLFYVFLFEKVLLFLILGCLRLK